MKVFVQNSRCPNQVLFAFDEVAEPRVVQVRWAVAYWTKSGCERLIQRVSERMGKSRWECTNKHFLTSLDFGLTEPTAIELLSGLPKSTVRIANPEVLNKPGLIPDKAYHPKLYLFDAPAFTGFVVGSANLTNSGLLTNTEVVAAGREKPENCAWDAVWSEVLFNSCPISPKLLAEYRKKWSPTAKRILEPDPKPVPPAITPGSMPVFWDAIMGDALSPMKFNHFWLEAGSMSSGGSHNQLELPRGANRFFGFLHTDYGNAHITIGHPALIFHGQTWKNRPLTWHGHNKMERINLPTIAQGGVDYRNTAVLCRRAKNGFEITVLPWKDDGAIAWRAASEALNTIFRFGDKGSRLCGLF